MSVATASALIIELSGVVKWFDPKKGYGFVTPNNGLPDVLLHTSCLQHNGYQAACEGTKITCEAVQSPKGLRCTRVLSMDEATAIRPTPTRSTTPKKTVAQVFGPERMVVKFFDQLKGFGFFQCPDEPDVFVHVSVLQRCGIDTLVEGQTMLVLYGPNEGDKHRRLVAVSVDSGRS